MDDTKIKAIRNLFRLNKGNEAIKIEYLKLLGTYLGRRKVIITNQYKQVLFRAEIILNVKHYQLQNSLIKLDDI